MTPIDELCVAGYVMVPPGETYTYSHRMTAALPGTNAGPTFDTLPIGGTYRLVWDLHEPRPGTSVLRQVRPLERVSNSFRLYELGPEAPSA